MLGDGGMCFAVMNKILFKQRKAVQFLLLTRKAKCETAKKAGILLPGSE